MKLSRVYLSGQAPFSIWRQSDSGFLVQGGYGSGYRVFEQDQQGQLIRVASFPYLREVRQFLDSQAKP